MFDYILDGSGNYLVFMFFTFQSNLMSALSHSISLDYPPILFGVLAQGIFTGSSAVKYSTGTARASHNSFRCLLMLKHIQVSHHLFYFISSPVAPSNFNPF